MEYRRLGRSALRVSTLCLGTMNFGLRTPEARAFDVLDAAVDAGINFLDTANQYGGTLGVGATESILGRWFAQRPGRRERMVLATKVHEPMSEDVNDRGLSARHIRAACNASLARLGVEHVDLYQFHHLDRAASVEEIGEATERLISEGKITYLGSSNFPGWTIAQHCERARAHGRLGLVAEQSVYNLLERRVELEVLPACREYGLGLIPWSPLAGGALAGDAAGQEGRRASDAVRAVRARHEQSLTAFETLAEELGVMPSVLALAWLLHQGAVTATIVGPADVAQLESVLAVPELTLDDATLARIDTLFPPCGPAPEAYAW
jgi:aryl-alcohol dehydrogenase-like predicted oxidoreductase